MMTATQVRRLEELKNRYSRYEVVCQSPTGERYLVGYTSHPGRRGMMERARAFGQQVIARTGVDDSHAAKFSGGHTRARLDLGNGWAICFTGRTERQAILEGELERV